MNTMDLGRHNYHHDYQGLIMPALKQHIETLEWPSSGEFKAVFYVSTLDCRQLAFEGSSSQ